MTSINKLESIQKRSLKWILNDYAVSYSSNYHMYISYVPGALQTTYASPVIDLIYIKLFCFNYFVNKTLFAHKSRAPPDMGFQSYK